MELNFQTEGNRMRKGFTLIELLVVVLIMGILASVAMPQYFKSVEKSRSAEAIGILSAIASAEERIYMKTGSYSKKFEDFDIGTSNLNYFTITHLAYDSAATGGAGFVVKRTIEAGGGLGAYMISVHLPKTPGTGERYWSCSPASAGCRSFLPK